MKTFLASILLALSVLVVCEPPAPQNQYLPPGQSPSNNYLPPNNHHQAASGKHHHNETPSSTYGAPTGFSNQPQTQYGAPNQQKAHSHQQPPPSAYGAPAEPKDDFRAPDTQYGAPAAGGNSGNRYSSHRDGAGEEENYGPAQYEFHYDVQDFPSGQDFGHKESRNGDKTVGRYYVLLPDGRKQIVEYEADVKGYHPVVSYEDADTGAAGAGAGRVDLAGGYDSNTQDNGKVNGY